MADLVLQRTTLKLRVGVREHRNVLLRCDRLLLTSQECALEVDHLREGTPQGQGWGGGNRALRRR